MSKQQAYAELLEKLQDRVIVERNMIANCANAASLGYHILNKHKIAVNWFGFYFVDTESKNMAKPDLVLGPFHGQPACTRIKYGKGVCGTCQVQQQIIIVPDVHQFEGHIACDSASNSEICIPLFNQQGQFIGEIDVDSPELNTFTEEDAAYLKQVAQVLQDKSKMFIL